ncbi:MAG: hypothetical protein Q8R00_00580 [Candidatus Nanoarchaeia archaeon]|nr:hypothetical protein [Candidatus Nanoarchaeia archaeon]
MAKKQKSVAMDEEIAELMAKYCVFVGFKMHEYLNKLVSEDLEGFKKKLEVLRELKC